jgi:hypothetical protein
MLRGAQIQWCRARERGQSGLVDADFVKKNSFGENLTWIRFVFNRKIREQ